MTYSFDFAGIHIRVITHLRFRLNHESLSVVQRDSDTRYWPPIQVTASDQISFPGTPCIIPRTIQVGGATNFMRYGMILACRRDITVRIPYACIRRRLVRVLHACRQVKVTGPEALPALVCIMTWSELRARASRDPDYLLLLSLYLTCLFLLKSARSFRLLSIFNGGKD